MLVSVVRVVGVVIYIVDFIGVSWNLFSSIDTTTFFYKNQ